MPALSKSATLATKSKSSKSPATPALHLNREAWLNKALELCLVKFTDAGLATPDCYVSVGFPSHNALSTKKRVVGQCFDCICSADNRFQLFVSPVINDSVRAVDVLVHEYLHASVGVECGHKGAFKRSTTLVGLTGKPTETTASPELEQWIKKTVIKQLGEYPHPAFNVKDLKVKKDSTRLIKAECGSCGYVIRTTRKWIATGLPTCVCGSAFVSDYNPDDAGDDDTDETE